MPLHIVFVYIILLNAALCTVFVATTQTFDVFCNEISSQIAAIRTIAISFLTTLSLFLLHFMQFLDSCCNALHSCLDRDDQS